jgi:broad specificity phosphatase PhoE
MLGVGDDNEWLVRGCRGVETLIAMRHGESVFNERGVLNGDPAILGGLTDRGREQAGRARDLLASTPIDLCVMTNFQRSIETADIILAGRDVPRLVVELLNDPPAGDFELRPYGEMEAWLAANGPEAPLPGTGRTIRECFETIRRGVILVASRPQASILAVIHGLAISWLLKSVGHGVLAEQAVPVFIAADDLDAMIDSTGDDVLRLWSGQDL